MIGFVVVSSDLLLFVLDTQGMFSRGRELLTLTGHTVEPWKEPGRNSHAPLQQGTNCEWVSGHCWAVLAGGSLTFSLGVLLASSDLITINQTYSALNGAVCSQVWTSQEESQQLKVSETMFLCQKTDFHLRVGSELLPQVKEFQDHGVLLTSWG